MTDQEARRVLYVVACGGRPVGDLPGFVKEAQEAGWEVCVIATPSALKFMDLPRLAELTGHAVRHDYKQPDEPDVLPPPDAMVVAPATFNTINKWAAGMRQLPDTPFGGAIPDPDGMLRDLLVEAIGECAACLGRDPVGGVVDAAVW